MDEAGRGIGLEAAAGAGCGVRRADRPCRLQAAVHAAARQLRVKAAPHRLDDVVERQRQAAAQLEDQGFFPSVIVVARRCGRVERSATSLAGFPARDGAGMDAELARQRGIGGGALLDIGAGARRGGGIGVQSAVASAGAPRGWGAQRGDGVTRTLAPDGFSRDAEIYDDARCPTQAMNSDAGEHRPSAPAASP